MSSDDATLSGLLQSYEHVLDTLGTLALTTTRLIEAQQRGERVEARVLAEYAAQLQTIEKHREQLQGILATWWQ